MKEALGHVCEEWEAGRQEMMAAIWFVFRWMASGYVQIVNVAISVLHDELESNSQEKKGTGAVIVMMTTVCLFMIKQLIISWIYWRYNDWDWYVWMDGWGGPPDAGAYPDWRLMSVHAFPSSSILCFFWQCERAAPANCCYDYSYCLNGEHLGLITTARLKVDMFSLFMGLMST